MSVGQTGEPRYGWMQESQKIFDKVANKSMEVQRLFNRKKYWHIWSSTSKSEI